MYPSASASASGATPGHTHGGTEADVETVEKLLAAVDRLRGERDELRRQLEFLQVESKFTIEALKNKINTGASSVKAARTMEDPRVLQLQSEVRELLGRLAKASACSRIGMSSPAVVSSRLGLVASASLAMVGHLQTRIDDDNEAKDKALIEISHLRSQLQDTMASSEESQRTSHTLQQSLRLRPESSTGSLHDTQQQRDDLLHQVEYLQSQIVASDRIRNQYQELQSSHERTTGRLADVTNALEDAESERNSLRVEVVNLQRDMVSAQDSLKQAEQRYSDLQNQQLSSMSSVQVNRKLKEQIEELEGRVTRRTEQIGIHQHDIKRLETNLKLQEDRIAEMTSELEIAMSEKESMVEDCADAREARDRALRKVDDLEDTLEALETQRQLFEAQRDSEVSALVEIWSSTLAQARSSITRLRTTSHEASAANLDMSQKLHFISTERDSVLSRLSRQASHLEAAEEAAVAHMEDTRNAVVTLAVVRTTDGEQLRAIRHDRDRICALLSATRDELDDRLKEISFLQDRLQGMRDQELTENTQQQTKYSTEVAKLQAENADLSRSRIELEDELARSRKELHLATERHDRLGADADAIKEQMAQLQTDHTEELESLRGKLQQVAVDLQEAREAYALAKKASSELSAANTELEGRLDSMSKQQDADSQLIANLQNREADHRKQMLGIQNRLDNATEDLRQTTCEKDDMEILLRQARTELSSAADTTEDRVDELLRERDALQEILDQAESNHATELAQVQERLQRLQTEADSLRAQQDKAISSPIVLS